MITTDGNRPPEDQLFAINKRMAELDKLQMREAKEGRNQQVRRIDKTFAILSNHKRRLTQIMERP